MKSNSGNLINHRSMNWGQFKDPLCYLCLSSRRYGIISVFYTRGCGFKTQGKSFRKNSKEHTQYRSDTVYSNTVNSKLSLNSNFFAVHFAQFLSSDV